MFKPTFHLKSVLLINAAFLRENGIEGLILDLDNTLSMHGSPSAEQGVAEWLAQMRGSGVKMAVVSNNTRKRVKPLADDLGLEFIPFGCKPLPFGINKGVKLLGLPKNKVAAVGDQIFTDVMGGGLSGVRTVLVEPFHMEDKLSFKFKRKIERIFYKRDFRETEK